MKITGMGHFKSVEVEFREVQIPYESKVAHRCKDRKLKEIGLFDYYDSDYGWFGLCFECETAFIRGKKEAQNA